MNWDSPASCLSTSGGCFCENHPIGSIVQPANTLSALAFLVVAVAIIWQQSRKRLAWFYALALLLVGIGTAYYHARLTFLGQTIDFGGMNIVILIAPFYYLSYRKPTRQAILIWLGYGMVFLLFMAELLWWPEVRRALFALLVLLVLGLYYYDPRKIIEVIHKKWLSAGLLVFLVGYIFWNFDTYRLFCLPESWLQGHALWHITSAIAAYCLFRAMPTQNRSGYLDK